MLFKRISRENIIIQFHSVLNRWICFIQMWVILNRKNNDINNNSIIVIISIELRDTRWKLNNVHQNPSRYIYIYATEFRKIAFTELLINVTMFNLHQDHNSIERLIYYSTRKMNYALGFSLTRSVPTADLNKYRLTTKPTAWSCHAARTAIDV